jgi:hypothetical protein
MTSLALLAFITLFGISFIPVYLLRRREYDPSRKYFIASECTPSGVVQNSSIAYSLQLAAFSQFFSWGANGDFWPAIVCSSMFGVGLYLMYSQRLPMLTFMSHAFDNDRSITVPGFVAQQHGKDARVQLFGAALTVFAFSGLVGTVALAIASFLTLILPAGPNSTGLIAIGLLALTMICTISAGNSGAMRSAQAQLGLLYLGLIGSILSTLYVLISSTARIPPRGTFAVLMLATCCAVVLIYRRSRYIDTSPIGSHVAGGSTSGETRGERLFRRVLRSTNEIIAVLTATTLVVALIDLYGQGLSTVVVESVTALQLEKQVSTSGFTALVLLPIFYPIVDTTNWLRIAALATDQQTNGLVGATRTPEAFARVLAMYAGASCLVWLLICAFGTIAGLVTGTPGAGGVLQSFVIRLTSQENEVADAATWMLLASMIAMAVLTMSAMFSAMLAAIRYDIVPGIWSNPGENLTSSTYQARAEKRAVFAGAGLCFAALLILIFLVDYRDDFIGGRFLSLQLACFCVLLAFSPLVLGPMIGGSRASISPVWAIAVLVAGVAAGLGVVILSFQPNHEGWLSAAVPACLGSGMSVYTIALLGRGSGANRGRR